MADSLFKELLIRSILFVQTQSLPASLDSSVFHSSLLLTQLSQFYLPRGILPTLLYLIPPPQSQPWSFLLQMSVLTSPASAGHCLLHTTPKTLLEYESDLVTPPLSSSLSLLLKTRLFLMA